MTTAPLTFYSARKRRNAIVMVLCVLSAAIGIFVLTLILGTLLWNGLGSLNLAVFTEMTPPPGSKGGLLNAIVGSLMMTGMGIAIGTPLGILAGTYMTIDGALSRMSLIKRTTVVSLS